MLIGQNFQIKRKDFLEKKRQIQIKKKKTI